MATSHHNNQSQMALSDKSSRQSLIPSFLYSSPMMTKTTSMNRPTFADSILNIRTSLTPAASAAAEKLVLFMIQAPSEPGKIEMYSPAFYAACTAGGILSCGLTHMAVTPFDLIKY